MAGSEAQMARAAQKSRLAQVEFGTQAYEMAHGKSPAGRGSWAFYMGANIDTAELFWVPGSVLYSEAKKVAAKEAVRRGLYRVVVAS